jgi:hypothetical protein
MHGVDINEYINNNNNNNNNNNKLYFTNLTWGLPKNMIHFVYNIIMTHSMHNITNSY